MLGNASCTSCLHMYCKKSNAFDLLAISVTSLLNTARSWQKTTEIKCFDHFPAQSASFSAGC